MDLTSESIKLLLETGQTIARIPTIDGVRPFAILPNGPNGWHIVPVPDELFLKPVSIRKTVAVYDADSFVEYFGKYSNPNSRVFVDLKRRLITAILDYHESGNSSMPRLSDGTATANVTEPPVARWGTHVLRHEFRHTRKWESWIAKNTDTLPNPFDHEAFADFMEEHLQDVVRRRPQSSRGDVQRNLCDFNIYPWVKGETYWCGWQINCLHERRWCDR